MKLIRKVGATSEIWQVFIQDSSSTTGAGLTGLVYNSGSLTAYYHRDTDTTATAITLVTMTVGTFTSSGFKEIDATNMPGWYQFCPPNAALASGAKSCGFLLKGAANMAPLPIEVDLDAQVDVTFWNGTAVASPATAGIPEVNVKNWNNLAAVALPLVPTTAGRTLDVSAGGEAGMDWANIGSPTTSQALTGTTIAPTQKVDVDTIKTNPVVNGGTFTFPTNATGASTSNITGGVITTTTNLTNAPTAGDFTATMKTSLNAATPAVTVSDKTGFSLSSAGIQAIWDALTSALTTASSIGKLLVDNINATISSRLASASYTAPLDAAGTRTAVGLASANLDTQLSGIDTDVNAVAGDVWDVTLASHLVSGSTGAALNAAGSSGDPWSTALPGAYGAGTAGKIVGDNIDATISSRSTFAGGAVASVTGNVGGNVTGSVGSVASYGTLVADIATAIWGAATRTLSAFGFTVDTNANATETAIKAKTDNLPAAPAAVSDIPTAVENADALLKRDWTSVTGEASRSALNALRFIRNKFSTTANAGYVTIYKEDDTTEAYTKALTTDPTAEPIVQG